MSMQIGNQGLGGQEIYLLSQAVELREELNNLDRQLNHVADSTTPEELAFLNETQLHLLESLDPQENRLRDLEGMRSIVEGLSADVLASLEDHLSQASEILNRLRTHQYTLGQRVESKQTQDAIEALAKQMKEAIQQAGNSKVLQRQAIKPYTKQAKELLAKTQNSDAIRELTILIAYREYARVQMFTEQLSKAQNNPPSISDYFSRLLPIYRELSLFLAKHRFYDPNNHANAQQLLSKVAQELKTAMTHQQKMEENNRTNLTIQSGLLLAVQQKIGDVKTPFEHSAGILNELNSILVSQNKPKRAITIQSLPLWQWADTKSVTQAIKQHFAKASLASCPPNELSFAKMEEELQGTQQEIDDYRAALQLSFEKAQHQTTTTSSAISNAASLPAPSDAIQQIERKAIESSFTQLAQLQDVQNAAEARDFEALQLALYYLGEGYDMHASNNPVNWLFGQTWKLHKQLGIAKDGIDEYGRLAFLQILEGSHASYNLTTEQQIEVINRVRLQILLNAMQHAINVGDIAALRRLSQDLEKSELKLVKLENKVHHTLYGFVYKEHVDAKMPEHQRAHGDFGRVGFLDYDGFSAPKNIKLAALKRLENELQATINL